MNHKRPPPLKGSLKTAQNKKEKPGSFSFKGGCQRPFAYQHKHCSTPPKETQDIVVRKSGNALISALLVQ